MRVALTGCVVLGLLLGVPGAQAAAPDGSAPPEPATKAAKAPAAGTTNAGAAGGTEKSGTPGVSAIEVEVEQLKDLLLEQSKQMQAQQQRIEALEKQLAATHAGAAQPTPGAETADGANARPKEANVNTTASEMNRPAATIAARNVAAANPQGAQPAETSPLQFRIGDAYITPVGFMDFTGVWRSRDGGSGIGTNFASIPYGNTAFQSNLKEFRWSMQNSRIGFRVDAMVKGAHVIGYMESDFLGNNPGNVAVSSNSNTLRSRLYWVDVRKGEWEVLGGQTWSLITPGRSGISPLPGDLFFTQNIDVNYQLGLVWGRIPELRVVYHPTDKAAFAVALDSPEQYIGGSAGGGLITLPSALSATYASELNNGNTTLGVPNRAPDVIAKLALDPSKKFHFEIGGVERQFQVFNPITATHYSATGGGGFVNLNFDLFQGFRLLTNNYWSNGGGRYIFGQAPDLVVRANGSPSLVHSGSTVTGFEYTHRNTMIYGYYGGLYVQRNRLFDANGTTPIGYGFAGSPSGQNRSVQEGTLGFNQTLWKDAKYGALNFMGQYSYLTRDPWSVATGQPKNAHLSMVFVNLRYTLPGSAPTLGK